MAYRSGPTRYDFISKSGQLGQQYLMFEREQAASGKVSERTCELYDSGWKFFRATLEPLELIFRNGRKSLTAEQRKAEERRIITALKEQRNIRTQDPKDPATPGTVNTYLRVMKTWINWMSDEERGAFLQFQWGKAVDELMMAVPETNGQTRIIWTVDQIDSWMRFKPAPNKFNQWRVWTIGTLMLDVGLRIEEALDLTIEDVKFESEVIGVWRKGNKYQLLPVGPEPVKHLFRYKNRFIDPYRTRNDVKWNFFGTHVGRPMSQRNSLRDLKVVLKKSGVCRPDPYDPMKKRLVPDLSWHEFRHTCATLRLASGESLDKVQRLLGHSNSKTTEIYLHLTEEYLKDGHVEHSPLNKVTRLPRLNGR